MSSGRERGWRLRRWFPVWVLALFSGGGRRWVRVAAGWWATAAGLLAGCATDVQVWVVAPKAVETGLRMPERLVAIDDGDLLFLSAADPCPLRRVRPEQGQWEALLLEARPDLVDLAAGGEGGPILVLCRSELAVFFAGQLVRLCELPAEGRRLSWRNDHVYLALQDPATGAGLLCRYELEARRLQVLLRVTQSIDAVCALPGGCALASGGAVYKFFEPAQSAPTGQLVLLFAVAGLGPVTSLLADESAGPALRRGRRRPRMCWSAGRVLSFFPVGGALAQADGHLWIASARTQQLSAPPSGLGARGRAGRAAPVEVVAGVAGGAEGGAVRSLSFARS
ncbi:MAG: hypothetical protein KatS3mg102_1930 [Planctomycetota bacterium]|nr:MAG: hypothetical protein KatS3mg102_1930 [Planctomycetota bacterium]